MFLKVERGKVVICFVLNFDGVFYFGNVRVVIFSYEYVRMYDGKFIFCFDDIDFKVKRFELIFYEWIKEDFEWFGFRIDEIYIVSDRFEIYYDYVEKFIKMGKVYVCICLFEKFCEFRDKGIVCFYREELVEV